MKFYKIKKTNENVAMIYESYNIRGVANIKTGECSYIKSLNLVMTEDGKYIAIGDDEIEFIKEIED